MKKDWGSAIFDDIGEKIQKLAKIITVLNIAASFIVAIVLFICSFIDFEYLWYLIFLAPVAGVVLFFITLPFAMLLFGFGKLIEDVEAIRRKKAFDVSIESEQLQTKTQPSYPFNQTSVGNSKTTAFPVVANVENQTISPLKNEVPAKPLYCPECGEDLSFMGWSETDFKEKQNCPLCGKDILLKK